MWVIRSEVLLCCFHLGSFFWDSLFKIFDIILFRAFRVGLGDYISDELLRELCC